MESQYKKDFEKELKRPKDAGLKDRQIIAAYRYIIEDMAEEIKNMPSSEAIELYKDILLRLL
jgi:hypothetical protein